MKIERPDWRELHKHSNRAFILLAKDVTHLNQWFNENVQPVNDALANGVEVTGYKEVVDGYFFGEQKYSHSDLKALLINIEPIKRKTREEKLEEFVEIVSDIMVGKADEFKGSDIIIREAKKLLEDK
jgi:hypothetical protein